MDTIRQGSYGSLALDLLYLFSIFAEAPIPMGIVEQLKLFEESCEIETAIRHLTDFSLLEE